MNYDIRQTDASIAKQTHLLPDGQRSRPVLDRRFSRRAQDDAPVTAWKRIKYAFVGLSSGAGTTSLALAFAEYLATGVHDAGIVAFVEISDAHLPAATWSYDRIGIDRHFAGRDYHSYYRLMAERRTLRDAVNLDGGVNWCLRVPGERFEPFDVSDYTRLINNAPGDTAVCDVAGAFGRWDGPECIRSETLRRIMEDADRVCVVIDPLPSAMMADPEKFEMIRSYESRGGDVVYIINKLNAGVNRRELKRFLRVRGAIELPFMQPSDLYTAEYNCKTLWKMSAAAIALGEAFSKIASIADLGKR